MERDVEEVVVKIHGTPHKTVLAVAGAGSSAMSWLLDVAGASRTVLEARVPYGRYSMIDLVGEEPAQYVSSENAREMARSSYRRGLALREDDSPVVGLACTATIATDRPKRGDHRACIAAWDETGVTTCSLTLDKGHRDRNGEETLVSRLVLQTMAQAFGVEADIEIGFTDKERPEVSFQRHAPPVRRLLDGEIDLAMTNEEGHLAAVETGFPGPAAVLPGSFNPLHEGHRRLAEVAAEITGLPTIYELAVLNVDKPPLEEAEILRRVEGIGDAGRVVLTRTPTFRQKAELFPGCAFIIGWDTMVRLIDPKYYGDSETAMLTALAEIWSRGCRFLVAGRRSGDEFHTLAQVPVPQGFHPLFDEIPESHFRADISSTELRERE